MATAGTAQKCTLAANTAWSRRALNHTAGATPHD